MPELDFLEKPHRRYNLLTGEWVLVSPHRARRPWKGHIDEPSRKERKAYDPECYLCPGNRRAGGEKNPNYTSTFVFDNDFSALHPDTPLVEINRYDLLIASGEPGICRVVCFSPGHDLTLPEMEKEDIRKVVDTWVDQFRELGALQNINYVEIFENKGEMMGCSNPHPHGQIWAQKSIPVEAAKEMHQMKQYIQNRGKCLLCDYLSLELKIRERVVTENDGFVVLVPFWAVWPFETLVISKRHFGSFNEISDKERDSLTDIVKQITVRYDNLFHISFPYSAGFHQSPTDEKDHPEWHFHMHFYPPLLRSATIRKFMVGYELLANPQRDVTPEWSTSKLSGS